jgi:hypothetical protein
LKVCGLIIIMSFCFSLSYPEIHSVPTYSYWTCAI